MGQVVPLQDMERMVEVCGPLGIIGCICRLRFLGLEEQDENDMTCMGMGVGMVKWERWPERYKHGVYFVSSEEAKEWLRKLNKKGFVQKELKTALEVLDLFHSSERFILPVRLDDCSFAF